MKHEQNTCKQKVVKEAVIAHGPHSWIERLYPSMAAPRIDLEKFNGKNDFNMWKVKMEALLITQGLGDAIELATKKEGKEGSSSCTPEQIAEIDKKAKNTIILSLSDSVIREVAKEKTVAELWAKLESLYMTKSLANRLQSLSLDEVKAALNTRGLQEKQVNGVHGDGLTVKGKIDKTDGKKKKQGKTKNKNKNLKCFQCHKEGHFKKDCPEKGFKKKGQNGDAAIVEEDGYESADVCVATEEVQKGKWILDSGCTFHMSPCQNFFSEYHKIDGGKVMMGNNAVCKVIGIGNISLKLHNGTIREVKQVRHVPDLKRNLISLGMLDQVGYSVRLEHGKIEILNGVTLVMKGSRKNGVYVLDGEMVTGESSVSTKVNMDATRLWHLRLGHMSIKGLKELAKTKDQVFGKFKDWKALVENQTGKKVKKLRTDNGLEYCNQMFDDFCASEGIGRHRIVRMTPQQNGLAEMMNRTLMNKVRCMMIQSKLPKGLWAETLLTACLLVNLSPSAAIEFKTPYELWSGKPGNYNNLKVFGCRAYAHTNQGKLEPRALKGQFVGYPDGVNGYKLWCSELTPPRCITSRDVVFNEEVELSSRNPAEAAESQDKEHQHHQNQTELEEYQLAKVRERRTIRPPKRYGYADLIAYALATSHEIDETEPKSYKEAVNSTSKVEWQKAMDDEITSLYRNNTWQLVRKPDNRRLVGCKWIYRIKNGVLATEPKRFKARLVAKGYTQKEGIDFKEVFSHVWYLRFDEFITSHGFNKCSFDCCVYYKTTKANLHIYLLLYVDDMLIACKQRDEIDALKLLFSSEFDMKDLGYTKKILGMEIRRNKNEGKTFLTQEKYLAKVLDTFGMQSCKPVMTPLASHFKLSNQQCPQTDEEKSEMLKIPYANAVGCMMYAMVLTRPDLAYALSLVSRYMATPGKEHWNAVKWILRYLKGTLGLGLQYGRSGIRNDGLSSLQHIVALLTTEAEYTAATEAVKEALWLKGMLAELGKKQQSVDIHCDSSSAIYLSKNPVHHERTKHIDVKLHFIRNEVSKGVIKMVKVHTDSNPADMLTKVVPTAKCSLCLDLTGVCSS
ncbi:hypothetical protein KPL71_011170 [Citrus sinensis]|uniref:Uncharacterized protein n=1 Tax=Citrus sinensis TaxID=2711 RepID=A0ACB8L1L9_CITSI|nr:hypothetical protein KPL71_011170 [Citrus sinensis]